MRVRVRHRSARGIANTERGHLRAKGEGYQMRIQGIIFKGEKGEGWPYELRPHGPWWIRLRMCLRVFVCVCVCVGVCLRVCLQGLERVTKGGGLGSCGRMARRCGARAKEKEKKGAPTCRMPETASHRHTSRGTNEPVTNQKQTAGILCFLPRPASLLNTV